MWIVIYREHGQLNLYTKFFGPFKDEDEAYEFLCTLPAIGHQTEEHEGRSGCKYTAPLEAGL